MSTQETLLEQSHAFMAERPYTTPEPNEIRDHHGLYNILIIEKEKEKAERTLESVLGAFGLIKAGVIVVDEYLLENISSYANEDGVTLKDVKLEPGQILQFDYSSRSFSVVDLLTEG